MVRWVRFRTPEGRVGFGSWEGASILEHEGDVFDSPRSTGREIGIDSCTLLSPCVPGKIVALWNNFHALGAKIGKAAPPHPLFFLKASTSLAGTHEPIRRPPGYDGKIIFEGELGIVIGKPCRNVSPPMAEQNIFGYTCVNDVTAIDILFENPDFPQWARSKSFDTFGCLGPAIVTHFDWNEACVVARLDGVERQNYPLADMIYKPHELVSLISQDVSLLPGDVIACGTSLGVGSIKQGVTVEIEIAGIGTLVNKLAPG
jgi:2-keto-4-pentenoate hydratase/2-oxohepta-3-ene-1,7-dioic acid hydratase in catechol pathway